MAMNTNQELLGLAMTAGTPTELLTAIKAAACTDDEQTLAAIARHENTLESDRRDLLTHSGGTVRAAAISSHLLPLAVVEALAHDSSTQVRFEIARHPGIGDATMESYLSDEPIVQRGLCEQPDLSVERLRILLTSPHSEVAEAAREAAADRGIKNLGPVDALTQALSEMDLEEVISEALGKSSPKPVAEPLDAAGQLALAEGELAARVEAAKLPELSGSARSLIATDEHPMVQALFARRHDLDPIEIAAARTSALPEVRAGFILGGSSTDTDRQALAGDSEPRVRAAVATVIESHLHRLALADDPSDVVKHGLLRQLANLELDVVCRLGYADDIRIRKVVALDRTEPERLDGIPVPELIEWKVTAWEGRLAALADGEILTKAIELAPSLPLALGEVATLAGAFI